MRGRGVRGAKGFALLAAVFLLLVLSMVGVLLAGLYSTSAKMAVEHLYGHQAMLVADAGVRWVFEREFRGDFDFSDNVSPTGAPSDPNSTPVSFGGGWFWVEYSNGTASNETTGVPTFIDLKVTAKASDSVRVVKTRLQLRATKALRRAIFDTFDPGIGLGGSGTGIDLRNTAALPGIGAIESSLTIQLSSTASQQELENAKPYVYQRSAYRRYLGIRWSMLAAQADYTGNILLKPGDPLPPGNIWHGHMTLDGTGGGPGFYIEGCLVGSLTLINNADAIWKAVSRDIDGDGIPEILPAVTGSVTVPAATAADTTSRLSFQGGVVGGPVGLEGPCSFSASGGPILGAVVTTGTNVSFGAGTGPKFLAGSWGLKEAPKWMKIVGPDVEYEFQNWKEEIVP